MKQNPIRVLQILSIMNRGGSETVVMNLYRKIDRSKIQFDFLINREEKGAYDDEILELGGKIYYVPHMSKVGHFKYIKELKKFFLKHPEYKIIHSHLNTWSGVIFGVVKKIGIPIRIAHSHISNPCYPFFEMLYKRYSKSLISRNATHYFACSKAAGKWLFGLKKVKIGDVKIINNAIDCKNFSFNKYIRSNYRKELNIENKFVIGHIGRFTNQKNHEFLIDIFSEIKKKNDNAVLLLIGAGKIIYKIQEKVKKLDLENSVKFLGIRSDIPNLLQAMDIFLFPSFYEGLGVTLVEAQAAGLKSIVSDTVPEEVKITDLIEFISLKKPAVYWADKILKYKSGYERKNMYKEIVDSGYDIKKNVKLLENIYLNMYSEV